MQQDFDLSQAFYRRLPEGLTLGAILGAVITTASGLLFGGGDSDYSPPWLMTAALAIAGAVVGAYLGAAWGIVQACFDALFDETGVDTESGSGRSGTKPASRASGILAK